MTTAPEPMGDELLERSRELFAEASENPDLVRAFAMVMWAGNHGPALLARLDAAEANARRMREGLEAIIEKDRCPDAFGVMQDGDYAQIARAALKDAPSTRSLECERCSGRGRFMVGHGDLRGVERCPDCRGSGAARTALKERRAMSVESAAAFTNDVGREVTVAVERIGHFEFYRNNWAPAIRIILAGSSDELCATVTEQEARALLVGLRAALESPTHD